MNLSVNITISAPLCACKQPSLAWGVDPDSKGKLPPTDRMAAMFVIECLKCRAEYRAPRGSFRTDIDWPGKVKKEKAVDEKSDGA